MASGTDCEPVEAVSFPALTPAPPYFAVVFSSLRTLDDEPAYAATAARMCVLAAQQPGYLGMESVRDADGHGITVSYWNDRRAIAAWQQQAEHLVAQRHGREVWYSRFALRIASVEEARAFPRSTDSGMPGTTHDFAALVASRKDWIQQSLRGWCRQALRRDLLLAEQEWFDIAGKADPAKTLWAWAWSRFPELVHDELGIDETAEVVAALKSGGAVRGYPDARQSTAGRLVLIGSAGPCAPMLIDDLSDVRRAND